MMVINRYTVPGIRYFKLQGSDGAIYILRHDESTGAWEMTLFDTGAHGRLSST